MGRFAHLAKYNMFHVQPWGSGKSQEEPARRCEELKTVQQSASLAAAYADEGATQNVAATPPSEIARCTEKQATEASYRSALQGRYNGYIFASKQRLHRIYGMARCTEKQDRDKKSFCKQTMIDLHL